LAIPGRVRQPFGAITLSIRRRGAMPADIEGRQFGEELKLAVRQVVVDPSRNRRVY
jgi:hypothetical protein